MHRHYNQSPVRSHFRDLCAFVLFGDTERQRKEPIVCFFLLVLFAFFLPRLVLMKNEVLDILILGLLVVLFTSIYRKRATSRLRCWVVAWILVLLHFASLMLPAASPWAEEVVSSLSLSTLLLSGVCFLFSASVVFESLTGRILVAFGIGMPALFYTNYLIFDGPRLFPLYGAAIIVAVSGSVLAWTLCRERSRMWAMIALTFVAGGLWTVLSLARQEPDHGILAMLSVVFATFAAFYWIDFQRTSAGVLTSILGLVAWAAVFPVGLICSFLVKAGQIPAELWNVPKYFVAFGMILTLLEDEFRIAARATEHYRLLFAAHPHPMWVHDPETLRILEVNDAAVTHYGYSREEFLSMSVTDLRPTEDVRAIHREHSATNSTKLTGPWRHLRKDGTYILVDMASHSIDFQGRKCSFVLVQDVTDRQQLHEQLVHQAHHDQLTGLPNRLLLEDRMQQSLAQAARYGQQAAILCLDLDRFKEINDSFGHAAGDLCLQHVVHRLSARLRAVDTFARTGGDEFVIILGELANKNSALTVARGVLESLKRPIEVDGYSFDVSTSIGISIYPDDGTDAGQLRRLADAAMYRAKQAGGGQYLLGSNQGAASEVGELESFLRNALENAGLELYYQPQYTLGGHLSSLQAGVRLHHPHLGVLSADRFLPVAEECGLIVPLGNWVLDEVCRRSMEWQRQRLAPMRVSFHVSPLQFLHGDFSARVLSTVAHSGLDPKLLELIVTESTVMRNRPEVASQMRSLAALGVHFSIADFGSSYSCLSHLHQLPVSTLKIDCSFVERISDPNGTYTIVQAIIALAHNLSLKVVAEGVERADQLECLRMLSCDFVQGLLLAPSLPAASVPKYLASANPPMARSSRR
jgi:diguanylate cyclase (GGDEF)-like protein/PAS domain S-box-containing protein